MTRPQRRRRSTLAGEHPAYPTYPGSEPRPAEPPRDAPVPEPPAAVEELPTEPAPPPVDAEGPAAPDAEPSPRARTRVPAPALRRGSQAEARARKLARDAAFGYAAVARRADLRLAQWAEAMAHSRALGTDPEVLGSYIREAAERAQLDVTAMPDEIWQAAGLPTPKRGRSAR